MGASFCLYVPKPNLDVHMSYRGVHVCRDLLQRIETTDEEVNWGIRAFNDHSDCDGDFSTEQCGYISKALKYFNKHTELHDGLGNIHLGLMKKLEEIFTNAYKTNGLVMIF